MKAQKQGEKQTRKQYDESFKRDAVALVTEQGHKVTDAARRVGINPNLIHRWKLEFEQETKGTRLTADEREELTRLRRENRQLLMETDILKKATAYFAKHSK
jgi:transposase